MLAYLNGDKIALAIDAGNSADHVDEFYKSLEIEDLKKPDFTVITHWHWDHTFGMHKIHGLSIAHHKTNEFLK
ncbi:TPA: MBL fold metallo-hydrolase [Streptococcus agalactiae]